MMTPQSRRLLTTARVVPSRKTCILFNAGLSSQKVFITPRCEVWWKLQIFSCLVVQNLASTSAHNVESVRMYVVKTG